jgi:2-polyprenyl-3-methyl-5-hydroxy-6-metoxy-1,4-benzoquinol methylase
MQIIDKIKSSLRKQYIDFISNFFKKEYTTDTFKRYDDYVDIQYRCEPKEFLEPRPRIVSSLLYALPILEQNGVTKKIYYEEGKAKGQLLANNISILDVGTRDGWTVEFLNSLGYPNVVGIELHQDYVDYANRKGRKVERGDIHKLAFTDNSFDFIYCRHVLEHCLDPILLLTQLMRVLKPNGVLYCSFPLVQVPFGKHTVAVSNLRTVRNMLRKISYDYRTIYIGRTKRLPNIIPEGDEVVIFISKVHHEN